ncbi:MAG: Nif3-like dinuclear metal center hexameric protein [Kiritimatiellae bacterium]|jgi:putative NIF3 family GTP cyclohydrolase 1 type 2|nr:Nif3-like dinuclear metal center hexameric protein [Kiritimatiellia bacterium]
MTTISDIIQHVEALTGHKLNGDEGVQHGDSNRELAGVSVAWMATPETIQAAGKCGHELLIVHESLYYPYNVIQSANPPPDWKKWQINRQRRSLLEQHDLGLLRIHGSADEICIFDAFAEVLKLGAPVFAEEFVKVYEIPACALHELVSKVKERIGMAHLRVADAGDMNRIVSRVGLPWGGMTLFVNVEYQQALIEQGCDVFIAGESDNYGFRFAAECGIPMIETSHELSENPGLHRFTAMLMEAFPYIKFRFHENDCIWRIE